MLDFKKNTYCGGEELHANYCGYTILIYTDEEGTLLTASSQDVFVKIGNGPKKLVKEGKLVFATEFVDAESAENYAQNKLVTKLNNLIAKQAMELKFQEVVKEESNDLSKMISDAFGKNFGDQKRSEAREELLKNLPTEVVNALLEKLREAITEEIKEDYADNVREVLLEEMRPEVREDLHNELSEEMHNGLR